jgi:hypothetical protein
LYPLDKDLYAQCHRIECCFLKLKQVRWLATGFEKTAKNDRAAATSASFFVTKLLTERLSQSVCAISRRRSHASLLSAQDGQASPVEDQSAKPVSMTIACSRQLTASMAKSLQPIVEGMSTLYQ